MLNLRNIPIFLLALSLFLSACSDQPANPSNAKTTPILKSQTPSNPNTDPSKLRIVSLTPAVTQIITDLGLARQIVGVGRIDPAAPPSTPIVGDFLNIDYEKLIALNPTHIFHQPERQNIAPKLLQLSEKYNWSLHAFQFETTSDMLHALYHEKNNQPAVNTIAHALNRNAKAKALVQKINTQLKNIKTLTRQKTPTPTLILVSSTQQLLAAGPETFLSQMLHNAGGSNIIKTNRPRYPVIDREKLLALNPKTILRISMTPNPPKLKIPPSINPNIIILSDKKAALPSTSIPGITAKIALLLHPDLAPQLNKIFKTATPP